MMVDYLGITTEDAVRYRRRADQELMKLEQQIQRGGLDQGNREVTIADNVVCECVVCFELKQATVYVGRGSSQKLRENPCFCCAPCLVAGLIIDVSAEIVGEEPEYDEDVDYFAEILICQAPDMDMPKKITLEEERSSGGLKTRVERVLFSRNYGAPTMYDVPFSDYHNHKIGDSVLVLVMPMISFSPFPGEYSPCINKRQVADGLIDDPAPTISNMFVNTTGVSCQIEQDSQVWDETLDPPPEPEPDMKYFPFRILPIKVPSCLS